jgi:hypothetical protein
MKKKIEWKQAKGIYVFPQDEGIYTCPRCGEGHKGTKEEFMKGVCKKEELKN